VLGASAETELVEDEAQRRADRHDVVARSLNAGTGDGHHALDDALAARQQVAKLGGRGNVENRQPDRRRIAAGRDFQTGQGFRQHLFRPLRVLGADRLHLDRAVRRQLGANRLHRVELVVLGADDRLFSPQRAHEDAGAGDQVLRLLDHDAVVGRQERLALATVDEHGVDLVILGRGQLDVGREGRAAKADQAGVLDRLDDLFRGHFIDIPRLEVADLLAVARVDLDYHRAGLGTLGGRHEIQPLDHPGGRGVLRHRDKAPGLGDQLAAQHLLSGMDNQLRRRAGVLGQRDHQFRRKRQAPDRLVGRVVLVVLGMDPVGERAPEPVCRVEESA